MPAVDDRAAPLDVPDLDHAVDAPGEDPPAVGVERHREHMAGVAVEVGQLAAGRHLPEPDAPVLAYRGEARAVGTERDAQDVPFVAIERPGLLVRVGFPYPDRVIRPPRAILRPSWLKATLMTQRRFPAMTSGIRGESIRAGAFFQSQTSTPRHSGDGSNGRRAIGAECQAG